MSLFLFILCIPSITSATVLDDQVNNLTVGAWTEIPANASLSGLMLQNSNYYFGNTAVWDGDNNRLLWVGGPGTCCANPATYSLVIYDEATDTWSEQLTPFTTSGHAYDAVAYGNGLLYFGLYGRRDVKTWDGNSWGTLPNIPWSEAQVAVAMTWFPEANGLVYVNGSSQLAIYRNGSWTTIPGSTVGSIHMFAEYNPIHGVVWFGSGNGNSQRTYRLNADLTVTQMVDAPFSMNVPNAIQVVDPASGLYLVFNRAGNQWWTFDIVNNQWANITSSMSDVPVDHSTMIGASLYEHNAIMLYRHNGRRTFLYRHNSGDGTPDAPAVTLTASPDSVVSGGESTITWSVSDATSCSASGGWSGSKNPNGGSETVSNITTDTTYTLNCSGPSGSGSGSVTVTMSSALPWEPTFVDNFNGTSLNPRGWLPNREILDRRIQYYDKDAISVSGGNLNIATLNRPESDRPYTSGIVTTQGLFKQQYGYFEMRAKLPNGSGFWPAFWLMPESGVWTSELDIMEGRGNVPDTIHYAYHYNFTQQNQHGETIDHGVDTTAGFNTYALDWSPERIDFIFNGNVVHSITDQAAIAEADSEMFVLLNVALPSSYSTWAPTVNASTDLDEVYEIDYVRVYERQPGGEFPFIPDHTTTVADLIPSAAYDQTALGIDRVDGSTSPDIIRSDGQVTGSIEVEAYRDNYDGVVSLILTPVDSFDSATGRYTKGTSLQTFNIGVTLDNIGDIQVIPYSFSDVITDVGAYIVDVIVRDGPVNNKKNYSTHRVVQRLDMNQPNTTALFDAFFRSVDASHINGVVTTNTDLQLQVAMLTPYISLNYIVRNSGGSIVASASEQVQHDRVGLITVPKTFNANLNPGETYTLTVSGSDSSGTYAIPEMSTTFVAGGSNGGERPAASLVSGLNNLLPGASVFLQWSSSAATNCSGSGDWSGALATVGSLVLGQTTTNRLYNLFCTGVAGSASDSASVIVN